MPKKLAIGTVARCKAGKVGLIIRVSRQMDQGRNDFANFYTGVCLDKGRVGCSWQSFHPEPIGTLDEWVALRAEELTHA